MVQKLLMMALGAIFYFQAVQRSWAQADAVKPPTRSRNYVRKEFTSKDGVKLPYWLMAPKTLEPGNTHATPAIVDGTIYVRTKDALFAFKSGK